MNKFRSIALLLVLILAVSAGPGFAQENTPQPEATQSVPELTLLSTINLSSQSASFVFTPEGTMLAVATDSGLQLIDPTTGDKGKQLVDSGLGAFVFGQDGHELLYAQGQSVKLLDLATNQSRTIGGNFSGDLNIDLNADASVLAVLSQDCHVGGCNGEIDTFDTASGHKALSRPFSNAYINDMKFSPDGKLLAYSQNSTGTWTAYPNEGTSFPSAVIHVVDLASNEDTVTVQEASHGVMGPLFFTPDSADLIYTAIVYSGQSPEFSESAIHVLNVETSHDDYTLQVNSVAYNLSADGHIIYSDETVYLPGYITFGGGSYLTRIETGEAILESSDFGFGGVAMNPDTTLIAISSGGSTVTVRDIASGDDVGAAHIAGVDSVYNLLFSPGGSFLAGRYVNNNQTVLLVWSIPA